MEKAGLSERASLVQHLVAFDAIPYVRTRGTALVVTIALISVALFLKQATNSVLSPSIPTLRDVGLTGPAASLPAFGSIAYGAGKLSQIFFSHQCGPRLTCIFSSTLGGVGLLIFTLDGPTAVYIGWIINQFGNGHLYGCVFAISVGWVAPDHHGAISGLLSFSQAFGALAYESLISALLAMLPFDEYGTARTLHLLLLRGMGTCGYGCLTVTHWSDGLTHNRPPMLHRHRAHLFLYVDRKWSGLGKTCLRSTT